MGTAEGVERSPAGSGGRRKTIHIDMDAFYASVEQRDHPELRGKPVAVGGSRERGVVAAASYEARRAFGVHSAMPSITAKRKCPDLIFVKPRFDAYKAISQQIREIFARYTPMIEPLSLDEAYLDVTENVKGIPSATQIAEEIRAMIRAETELTASAGVSYNKFLAKLASDHRKPDGLFVITPKMGPSFVETQPVRKFHGIGPATARKMAQLDIETGFDLKGQSLDSCSTISERRGLIITGPRAASTNALCAPTGRANRWAPRTHFPPISLPMKPRGMRFEKSPARSGGIARAPVCAVAL
jgi:DNA polymerase-4